MKNTYNSLYALDSYRGSSLWLWCVCMLSCVPLFATRQTAAHQALLFMVFSQRNTGVGCYFLLQGIFQTQRSFHAFPELQVDFFAAESPEYFGLELQNEAGKRLPEFCQEDILVIASTLFQKHKRWLHMDITRWSTEIRLIIFFAAEDGETLYSQQKEDLELTVAQTISTL